MPLPRKKSPVVKRPVVWVVGASRGIGAEIAAQFAAVGCSVWLSGRSVESLGSVQRRIALLGGRASTVRCDVRQTASIERAVRHISAADGPIDVLINNAGVTVFRSVLGTTLRDMDEVLRTTLRGPIACVKSVLPSMVSRRSGCIVNILSNAAVKTFEDSAVYTAAKAGLLGFARVLREELRRSNVRVVNVLPGATETGMWSRSDRRRYGKRMMRPRSVAEAVLAVVQMPPDLVVDEILLRPMLGDIGSQE